MIIFMRLNFVPFTIFIFFPKKEEDNVCMYPYNEMTTLIVKCSRNPNENMHIAYVFTNMIENNKRLGINDNRLALLSIQIVEPLRSGNQGRTRSLI